ncbi:MAG: DHA2 family efflux MFS transporter permease subunit [Alphaproteobacteria bacterium]|nr:DHA2 family efflux MFS transporter permease subunit [Alphaproteobacteria bacterium]
MSAPVAAPAGVVSLILLTLALCCGPMLVFMDAGMVLMAVPHMQGSLQATQDQVSWVTTSYFVTLAAFTPATGWLAGRFGRKRVYLTAVAGFTVASALSGLAPSLGVMVACRVAQGIFGASMVPLAQSTLMDVYPAHKRGLAISIFSFGGTMGPMLGPLLGGYLVEHLSWRWMFVIDVGVGVFALMMLSLLLRFTPPERGRAFDGVGFALLAVTVGALQLILDRGERMDWFASPVILTGAAIAAVGLYVFVVRTALTPNSFFNLELLRDRNLALGLVFGFSFGIVQLATVALVPPFVLNALGYPPDTAGLLVAYRGYGVGVAMIVCAYLLDRVDPRLVLIAGLLMTGATLWHLSGFTADSSASSFAATFFIQGAGVGSSFVGLSTIAFATLRPQLRAEASSFYFLAQTVGGTFGLATLVTLFTRMRETGQAVLVEQVNPFNPLFAEGVVPGLWDPGAEEGLARLNEEVIRQATMVAYISDFQLLVLFPLAAIPAVLLLRRPPRLTAASARPAPAPKPASRPEPAPGLAVRPY